MNFKIGDKVVFTQKAKDRLGDNEYWRWVNNSSELKNLLNKVLTVEAVQNYGNWPSVYLSEFKSRFYVAQELLEPANVY